MKGYGNEAFRSETYFSGWEKGPVFRVFGYNPTAGSRVWGVTFVIGSITAEAYYCGLIL